MAAAWELAGHKSSGPWCLLPPRGPMTRQSANCLRATVEGGTGTNGHVSLWVAVPAAGLIPGKTGHHRGGMEQSGLPAPLIS